jgi:hypothetical protein
VLFRSTDLDNVLRMCLMTVGIPTTATRIIAWPNGDSNHEILSFKIGKERFDLNAITTEAPDKSYLTPFELRGAKIYEEKWGDWSQASAVAKAPKDGEKLPWHISFYLGTRSMTDVTDRYTQTTSIKLSGLKEETLVFLGVFNNSSDVPSLGIATVALQRADEKGNATFCNVGNKDNLYFAYYYDEVGGEPTADVIGKPFIAHANGSMEQLGEEKTAKDGYIVDFSKTFGRMEPEKEYVLMAFEGGRWEAKKSMKSDSDGKLQLEGIQQEVLYVLKNTESGEFLRPFVLGNDEKIGIY